MLFKNFPIVHKAVILYLQKIWIVMKMKTKPQCSLIPLVFTFKICKHNSKKYLTKKKRFPLKLRNPLKI